MECIADLQAAFDSKTAQRGEIFERAASGGLIDVACVADAVLIGELVRSRAPVRER